MLSCKLKTGTSFTQRREKNPPETAQPAVKPSLAGGQLVNGCDKTHHIQVCQRCTHLTAAAHTADVTHLHKNTDVIPRQWLGYKFWELSIYVKKQLKWLRWKSSPPVVSFNVDLGFWPTNLDAEGQQGGSDWGAFRLVQWALARASARLRPLLLAAVQQHRLDAVTISQEQGVALTSWQIPNTKAIRQLRQQTNKEMKIKIHTV